MQKTILYLLLLIILGTGVYYFVFSNKENVFGAKEAGFTIKDTSSIGQIFMVRTNGESVKVTRTDSGWVVNDRYKVRDITLRNLITTLYKQSAQYPVPENAHNNVIKNLAGNSTKVEVYGRKGNLMRTFYVGSEAHSLKGTYMLLEHAQKAYVVGIPMFDGFLNPYYTTDITDWRDRTIFNLKPDEIKTVSVTYQNEPLNTFTINNVEKISVTTEPGVAGSNPLNEQRATSYLKFFEHVYAEGFLNGVTKLDSIIGSVPLYCQIEVQLQDGDQKKLDIYYMPITKRSKNRLSEVPEDFDPDRFYAVTNNYRDTVLIQYNTFEKFFRKAYEFYQADKADNSSVVGGFSK